MSHGQPVGEVDERFSADDAQPVPWSDVERQLRTAEIYWLSTVRSDGRPHVTPLIAIWFERALWFCTGPGEQKAVNLVGNAQCAITTGTDRIGGGRDLVIEGRAEVVHDESRLRTLAGQYTAKYGADWTFSVDDGAFFGGGGRAAVYRVEPRVVLGFSKGDFSQTRWRL